VKLTVGQGISFVAPNLQSKPPMISTGFPGAVLYIGNGEFHFHSGLPPIKRVHYLSIVRNAQSASRESGGTKKQNSDIWATEQKIRRPKRLFGPQPNTSFATNERNGATPATVYRHTNSQQR